MAEYNQGRYWFRTSRLMWVVLLLWAVFGLGVHIWVDQLNQFSAFGIPLGHLLAAQGTLIASVVILALYLVRQEEIDREEGVAEDH